MALWQSPSGRMTLDGVSFATGLTSDEVLAVFRQCEPVFRHESISGSGAYRYLLTPPNALRQRHADRVCPQRPDPALTPWP